MAAHRTSFDPCLVTLPRRTLRSDSRCLGVSPAHEHNASGVGKRVHVADLDHEHRAQRAADTVELLDRAIAAMVA